MFVDKARIQVRGGKGGNGCVSFRREKRVPFGGPNGGNGGHGGDVIIVADAGEQSLISLYYNRHFRAIDGEAGRGKDQHGARGRDIEIRVPLGTIVKDVNRDLAVLCDMDEIGKTFVVAHGGRGGRGNATYLSNANRAPREFELGGEGEVMEIEMELKVIADVGLVGYPNAGKSTLLGAVSAAKPKAAPYPFTTLRPTVGTLEFEDYSRMTIADIPGLIEGAHDNIGLGHDFLRHIERTRVLVYVLDMAGVDGRDPLDDFQKLKTELDLYQKGLSTRAAVIAANKIDLPEAKEHLAKLETIAEFPIVPISAELGVNLDELIQLLRQKVRELS